ncbi:MAG: hypothetical protein QOG73_382 [Acetobacteraceae bacterium]|jgi:hypothetical protein|nr:hypothetical protein [Acetobacteraceae bacterium]
MADRKPNNFVSPYDRFVATPTGIPARPDDPGKAAGNVSCKMDQARLTALRISSTA